MQAYCFFLWTRHVYFCIWEVRRMYSANRGLKPSPLSEPSLRKPNICCKYILNIDELEQHQTWIVHICVVLFPSFTFPIWLKWLFVTSLIFWVYEFLTEIFWPRFFSTKNFFHQKSFDQKKKFWPKTFATKNFFDQKLFWPKNFWSQIFWTRIFSDPKT